MSETVPSSINQRISRDAIIRVLGYEWCKPLGDARLLDYVAIGCGGGHAVLCRVEQNLTTGEVRRVMVKPSDLARADE